MFAQPGKLFGFSDYWFAHRRRLEQKFDFFIDPTFVSAKGIGSRSYTDPGGDLNYWPPGVGTLTDSGGDVREEEIDGLRCLLLEPEGANILLGGRGSDFSGWNDSGSPSFSLTTGIDGQANKACTVTDNGGAGVERIENNVSVSPNSGPWALTFSVKYKNSTNPCPVVGVVLSGGTTKLAGYVINPQTGATQAADGFDTADSISIIEHGQYGDFWLYTMLFTDNGGNSDLEVRIYPAWNSSYTAASDGAATGSNTFDWIQLEYAEFPSSLIDTEGVTIGSDLVTDGTFDTTSEGTELDSGNLTVGNCYKITAQDGEDFTADGAPDNNVGTYFNATGTNVTLDANDKVVPITFDNWTEGTGWAPEADSGSLTGKAIKTAGTAADLEQDVSAAADKAYRIGYTLTRSAGSVTPQVGGVSGDAASAAATRYDYVASTGTGNLKFAADADFAGTIDAVTVKEHGTVRPSEEDALKWTKPSDLDSLFTGESFTVMMLIRFPSARTGNTDDNYLLKTATVGAGSVIYTFSTGFRSYEGTTGAYVSLEWAARTWYWIIVRHNADTGKYWVSYRTLTGDVVNGTKQDFDGAYDISDPLTVAYLLDVPVWVAAVGISRRVESDAWINSIEVAQ